MRLIVVSGLSGSGKSVALNTLEDEGFYCIDNLPTGLLYPLVEELRNSDTPSYDRVAVGIDARSRSGDLLRFPEILDQIRSFGGMSVEIVFLQTEINTLLRRFSETRRKHPLSQQGTPLIEAIELERALLAGISERADFLLETTHLTLHELRGLMRERLLPEVPRGLSLLFQSFGYKNGVPADTDFVFDVRSLPNPHWEARLRALPGDNPAVIEYLEAHDEVQAMFQSIRDFLDRWIPSFHSDNRSYLTVSIGCTGGQHRSVYLADRLAHHFGEHYDQVSVRHSELQQGIRTTS